MKESCSEEMRSSASPFWSGALQVILCGGLSCTVHYTLCAKFNVPALRTDDSPGLQTLAALPLRRLSGSSDLAPRSRGFPRWRPLVEIKQDGAEVYYSLGCLRVKCRVLAGSCWLSRSHLCLLSSSSPSDGWRTSYTPSAPSPAQTLTAYSLKEGRKEQHMASVHTELHL